MAFKCIAFLLSCFLLKYCIYGEKAKGKYLHPFSGEAYKTLLLLVQGTFNMPVAEGTREQKNAVMRYWRNRDRFHLGPQVTLTLYFDDKKVVKKSTISGLVSKLFDDAKSGGWKKLRNRAAAGFVGLREKQQTVTAKSVHLMDLSKDAVEHDRRVYRYVLSVMMFLAGIIGCAHWKRKQVIILAKPLKRFIQNMVHQITFKATVDRSLKVKLDLFVRH